MSCATWHQDLVQRGYTAFIFDCDGTLVESADVHFAAFEAAASEQGFTLDRDWYLARTGLDRQTLFQEFAIMVEREFNVESAVSRSISNFIALSARVKPIAETETLVRMLSPEFPLAVGTNAEKSVAEASLRATELFPHFNHIVAISDGHAPKPAPDIFSHAATLLGAPPDKTLVIEDSEQGVLAAQRAGLDVIELEVIQQD